MSDQKQVAVASSTTAVANYFPSDADWKMMLDVGSKAVRSGMLPQGIKTPEAAAIIALKARELNMPIMVGFAHIHVINGKPTLSAEMMQALARKNLPGLVINIIESTAEKAIVEFIRPEQGSRPYKLIFTIEDAKKADLMKNPTWQKYPAAMLWSRAVSAGLRKVCPEALIGVSYTPEEMGAHVDSDGNVIETTSRPATEAEKQAPQESERVKLQKQMIELVNEKNIPQSEIKDYLVAEFDVETSKSLSDEKLKIFVTWLGSWLPASKESVADAEWEQEAMNAQDPRMVK